MTRRSSTKKEKESGNCLSLKKKLVKKYLQRKLHHKYCSRRQIQKTLCQIYRPNKKPLTQHLKLLWRSERQISVKTRRDKSNITKSPSEKNGQHIFSMILILMQSWWRSSKKKNSNVSRIKKSSTRHMMNGKLNHQETFIKRTNGTKMDLRKVRMLLNRNRKIRNRNLKNWLQIRVIYWIHLISLRRKLKD